MGPDNPTQGAVPTAPMSQIGGGVNPEELLAGLYQQHAAVSKDIQTSLAAAIKPISAPGNLPNPETVMGQQRGFQRTPLDTSRRVGAANVKKQNIGNAIKTAANVVGGALEKRTAEKRRALAIDIESIYETSAGMQEAQAALQADPNDANAKAAYQKNKERQDALLSDPKKTKQFEKAFNINFVDPSKNNSMEHGAMKDASTSYAEQLQKKQGEKLAPNVQAIQRVAALQQQQAALEKLAKPLVDNINNERTNQTHLAIADAADQTRMAVAKVTQEAANRRAEYNQTQANARAKIQQQGANTRAGMHEAGANSRTAALVAGRQETVEKQLDSKWDMQTRAIDAAFDRITAKNATPTQRLKDLSATANALNNQIKAMDADYGQKLFIRDAIQKKGGNQTALDDANHALYYSNELRQQATDKLKIVNEGLVKMSGAIDGSTGSNTGGRVYSSEQAAASAEGGVAGPTDDTETDPNSYE